MCKKKVHRVARDQVVGGKTYKVEKRLSEWLCGLAVIEHAKGQLISK